MDRGATQTQWTSMHSRPNLRSTRLELGPMDDPNTQISTSKLSRYWEDASDVATISMLPANAPNSLHLPETAPPEVVAGTGKQGEDRRTPDNGPTPNRPRP